LQNLNLLNPKIHRIRVSNFPGYPSACQGSEFVKHSSPAFTNDCGGSCFLNSFVISREILSNVWVQRRQRSGIPIFDLRQFTSAIIGGLLFSMHVRITVRLNKFSQ
jgi:hypothetical protein